MKSGLVVSATKIKLFQTKVSFFWNDIHKGTTKPIIRAIELAYKFLDEIKDKTQLQRFLGCFNYVVEFFPKLRQFCNPRYKRLQNNPSAWSSQHTHIVKVLKEKVKALTCLVIPHPHVFMMQSK